jgi:hypothetical protein
MRRYKYKEDEYVLCPYYRKESQIEIKCAGICGKSTANVYQSEKDKTDYKENFCSGFYWNCPLYRALDQDGK